MSCFMGAVEAGQQHSLPPTTVLTLGILQAFLLRLKLVDSCLPVSSAHFSPPCSILSAGLSSFANKLLHVD